MGVRSQKAVKHLLIANDSAVAATLNANISSLADGQVAVAKLDGTILDNSSVNQETVVVIAQGQASGLPIIVSPPIKKAGVRTYTGGRYIAEVPQVDFVGYNGTSGSIDVLNSNAYDLRIYQFDHAAYAEKSHAVIGYHKSDSTATQAEIAAGVQLVATDTLNGLRLPSAPFKIEALCSFVKTTPFTGPTALAFVKGSKVVTGTTNSALTGAVVAGDFISIDGTLATPVYKVRSVTAGSSTSPVLIFLESAYQEASSSPAVAAVGFVSAANAASANFGIKVTGITQTVSSSNVLNGGLEEYYPIRFKTIANGFGSTVVATGTPFVAGNGLPVQVAALERQLLGNEGYLFAGSMPYVAPRSNVNFSPASGGYAFIHLEYTDKPVNAVLGFEEQPKQLDIAGELLTSAPTFGPSFAPGNTSVFAVLESWLVSNGNFNTVATTGPGGIL